MNAPADVVITGTGIVSAAGIGVERTWKTILSGLSPARADEELSGLAVDFSCRVPGFTPDAFMPGTWVCRTDRCSQLAFAAAQEAFTTAGLDPDEWESTRVGVIVGTAFGGITTLEQQTLSVSRKGRASALTVPMTATSMVAGQLSLAWRARGPSLALGAACASGATAIGFAAKLLREDTCDIVLAGGTDAPMARVIAASFARMGALSRHRSEPRVASRPFDASRDGFVLGEGAGMLVLERHADAVARRAAPLAFLAGFGASADAHHLTDPHPDGSGLQHAINTALTEAGAGTPDVDHINAHATSTPKGDLAEGTLIARLFRHRPVVTAPKGVLGHTMGAAGAIEAALTVRALQDQIIPPTANLDQLDPRIDIDVATSTPRRQPIRLALSHSSGFGGQNAVVALSAP